MRQIVLAAVMLVLIVCAAEVGLRFYLVSQDTVSTAEKIQRRLLIPSRVVHHEMASFVKFTVKHPDEGRQVVVRTSSFGTRGSEPAVPKPSGLFRILCLGDETVAGFEVDESATMTSQLQELLQQRTSLQVEVVNAGVPRSCPLLAYLQYRHRLAALAPDLVIAHFDMSDVADDFHYRRHTRLDLEGTPLAASNPILDQLECQRRQRVLDQFAVTKFCLNSIEEYWEQQTPIQQQQGIDSPRGRYRWLEDQPPDWKIYIDQAFLPLAQLRRLTDSTGTRLVISTSPVPWQVSATASDGQGVRSRLGAPRNQVLTSRSPFEQLASFTSEQRLLFCDASPVFQGSQNGDQLFLRNSARLSRLGHQLYAQVLTDFITTQYPAFWNGSGRSENPPGNLTGRSSDTLR